MRKLLITLGSLMIFLFFISGCYEEDPVPAAPEITASDGLYGNMVNVGWPAVTYASFYQVFRSRSNDGEYTNISGYVTGTSYNDVNALPDIVYYYKVKSGNDTGTSEFSDPDSGYSIEPTVKATNPYPANGAVNADQNLNVEWTPNSGAISQQFYAGTTPGDLALIMDMSGTESKIDQGTMAYRTWHYWRVDTIDDAGTHIGDTWRFYTPNPEEDETTYPLNGAVYIYKNADLSWPETVDANAYNVYFGTDPQNLTLQSSRTATTYDPGMMNENTWYYWRIDIVNASGTVTGEVWRFFVPGLITYPSDGEPIGGGYGYTKLVTAYDYYVETRTELLDALGTATYGDVIYVADDAEIDLTGMSYKTDSRLIIPGGVTLASGRGTSPGNKGGLIHKDAHMNANALFLVNEPDVRITGLRLRGPEPFWSDFVIGEEATGSRGISLYNEAEVDNCELYHWSYAAVDINNAQGLVQKIHHNYIHDCHGPYGYGVEMGLAEPLITANIFEKCRHDITGIGKEYCSYEASYNISLEGAHNYDGTASSNFDMHGSYDYGGTVLYWMSLAGSWMKIHHNTFSDTHTNGSAGTSAINGKNICLRGKPRQFCDVYENWFFDDNISHAVREKWNTGNMTVRDNYVTMDRKLQEDAWDVGFWPVDEY